MIYLGMDVHKDSITIAELSAAITGDFVMRANEVNPVIRVLQAQEIDVAALHSHMLAEGPRLFFMHFGTNAVSVGPEFRRKRSTLPIP